MCDVFVHVGPIDLLEFGIDEAAGHRFVKHFADGRPQRLPTLLRRCQGVGFGVPGSQRAHCLAGGGRAVPAALRVDEDLQFTVGKMAPKSRYGLRAGQYGQQEFWPDVADYYN